MNKNQGTTIGAIVLAGLLLRPAGSSAPPATESDRSDSNLPVSSQPLEAHGEGPWIASCKYWAAARLPEIETKAGSSDEVHHSFDETNSRIDWHLWGMVKDNESGCKGEDFKRWGFPENNKAVDVTAVIATVPDPVHTHLAMAFDRTVDALLQAAADNNYVSSYYWLPWRNRGCSSKPFECSGDAEPGHDSKRERQPGLIVLKYVPAQEDVASFDTYHRVIYLFLVAETPTQGVDGFQLHNAFSYEDVLEDELTKFGERFSRGHRSGATAIIGPMYSGSAASLRIAIETEMRRRPQDFQFDVAGATGTFLALNQLTAGRSVTKPRVSYLSFDQDGHFDEETFVNRLKSSGYDLNSVALLTEDNTALGNFVSSKDPLNDRLLRIRFPREISLLRNAEVTQATNDPTTTGSVPGPYLHLSLKDSSAEDSVPQFSRENTPLSQEAQMMAIARQFHRNRIQFIAIVASNSLDQIFLAQFLHRACPDARLVFFGSDLLMVREVDNVPFIGTITVTPYSMIGLGQFSSSVIRAYPDSQSEAYYNAASYTFWDRTLTPRLKGYRSPFDPHDAPFLHPSLWATTIGADGYYPLSLLSPCASSQQEILPTLDQRGQPIQQHCQEVIKSQPHKLGQSALRYVRIYPSLLWVVLCLLVSLLCLAHFIILCVADYWSPFTRDLAIGENDQPRRRSAYIQVGVSMLVCMAFVVAYPVISLAFLVHLNFSSILLSAWTLACGLAAFVATIWKSRGHIGRAKMPIGCEQDRTKFQRAYYSMVANVYFFINLLAWITLSGVVGVWTFLCSRQVTGEYYSYVGLSFSFRCIHPASGVSPIVPMLLLLISWYVWAFFQTWRLRFSDSGRPWLPRDVTGSRLFFVSDDDLRECDSPRKSCLYKNITCLLITRQVIRRFRTSTQMWVDIAIDGALVIAYGSLLICFSLFSPIRSLDHFLSTDFGHIPNLSCPYEFLVSVLFFPLLVVALSGWLRLIVIWGALRRGLLDRLENQPIRFAFSRLKGMGWMTMLRQGGLKEQWRDMARSVESIRQILHDPDLIAQVSTSDHEQLAAAQADLLATIAQLQARLKQREDNLAAQIHDYYFMKGIEVQLARFAELLLSLVLIPYWQNVRSGLVDSGGNEELPIKARRSEMHGDHPHLPMELHAATISSDPTRISLAEEFVAIRYVSLIRAVLTNLRYLMLFVSVSFVLSIIAWNSYPFQPRQWVDWLFTGLLVFLGSGIIWVFAQMYRNPILSRITETKANELGWDFYFRVLSFGALPVLTWLAYEFPDIGNIIFKILQPGIDVVK